MATNVSGIATAPTFSANTTAGAFTLTATAPGASNNPANFSLKNLAGPANKILVTSGSGQSAVVNAAYTNPLVATVTDAFQNPVTGISVTFNPPASSGPSVVFTGSTTVVTDVNGAATSSAFSANTHAGPANTTATSGSLRAASFTLTNLLGPAKTITPLTGSGQSAQTNAAFTNPLVAQVSDQFGNGISGLSVTFTAPASGASGNFPGPSPTVNINTTTNGVATSPTITANNIAGGYTVTTTVAGARPLRTSA